MPAVLDDPTAPPIFRVPNDALFTSPFGESAPDISLRQVTLRDRTTIATLVPFSSPRLVPHKLLAYLCELLNREIEKGDTYPMMNSLPVSSFGEYWFGNFGAAMIMGDIQSVEELGEMDARGTDWSKECLGSFFIKPNYPGRSSHICNGGFLVTDAKRNRGVGRLMGEGYIEWAPKLGYTYSVFNLVYETNVASLRIWDALGFKRIGRIKGAGNLKSQPGELVDAIMFGRELGGEGDEYVSEERFDKIRFYLKTGTYPNGSDRAEKSRLRSAATHYRLIPGSDGGGQDDKLMLKGKEVVSDPHKQYEIARNMHNQGHGGINKTTASIAEHFHWVRIKETVNAAIKNCLECKDSAPKKSTSTFTSGRRKDYSAVRMLGSIRPNDGNLSNTVGLPHTSSMPLPHNSTSHLSVQHSLSGPNSEMTFHNHTNDDFSNLPVDPQIMHEINEHTLEQWDEAAAAVAATNAVNGPSSLSLDRNVVDTDDTFKLDLNHDHRHIGGHGNNDDDDDDDINARLRETLEAEMGNDVSLQHHQHSHHDQHQHHHLQHHQHQGLHQQHPHHLQHPLQHH